MNDMVSDNKWAAFVNNDSEFAIYPPTNSIIMNAKQKSADLNNFPIAFLDFFCCSFNFFDPEGFILGKNLLAVLFNNFLLCSDKCAISEVDFCNKGISIFVYCVSLLLLVSVVSSVLA